MQTLIDKPLVASTHADILAASARLGLRCWKHLNVQGSRRLSGRSAGPSDDQSERRPHNIDQSQHSTDTVKHSSKY